MSPLPFCLASCFSLSLVGVEKTWLVPLPHHQLILLREGMTHGHSLPSKPPMPTALGLREHIDEETPCSPAVSSKDMKGARGNHPAETIAHIFLLLQEGLLEGRDAGGWRRAWRLKRLSRSCLGSKAVSLRLGLLGCASICSEVEE